MDEREVDDIPEDSAFRLGFKTRIFNFNLRSAVRESGKTMQGVADDLGVSKQTLYRYLAFRAFPDEERKLRMALYFNKTVDSLFPDEIAGIRLEKQPEAIGVSMQEAEVQGLIGAYHEDYDGIVAQGELEAAVSKALMRLPAKEEKVLLLRFGLMDGQARTLDEVAKELGLTRSRIHQIEYRALRKLRHPSQSKFLRDFLEA